jgi:hypothetical protein
MVFIFVKVAISYVNLYLYAIQVNFVTESVP